MALLQRGPLAGRIQRQQLSDLECLVASPPLRLTPHKGIAARLSTGFGPQIGALRRSYPLSTQTLSTTLVTEASTAADTEAPKPTPAFQWEKVWYPMMPMDCLDATRPTPIQLLAKDLVIWCDASGAWSCAQDQCPHRLAPLSGG
jgi:hypothetical protein